MRCRRALALIVTSAALAVPASLQSASAESCAPTPPSPSLGTDPLPTAQETRIRWTRVMRTVEYGDTASLAGQVVTDDGALGGAEVHLFEQLAGSSGWHQVASTTSDADTGVFGFGCLALRRTTRYRVVFDGDLAHAGSERTQRVGVTRQVPDEMQRTGRTRFVYSGSVAPRYRGPVLLQRRGSDGQWRRVAARHTDRRSTWRFVLEGRLSGSYRALVPGSEAFLPSPSDHVWRFTSR